MLRSHQIDSYEQLADLSAGNRYNLFILFYFIYLTPRAYNCQNHVMTQTSPCRTACPVPVVGFPRECSRGSRASTWSGSPRVPWCLALGWAAGGSASLDPLWAAGKNWSENRNRQKGSNFAVKHPFLLEGNWGQTWERRLGSQEEASESKMRPSLLWSNRRWRLQGSRWKYLSGSKGVNWGKKRRAGASMRFGK